MLKNFNPSSSSRNPRTTFTEFSHPPDFGKDLSHEGNKAKRLNGMDNATAKPSIPMAGANNEPLDET